MNNYYVLTARIAKSLEDKFLLVSESDLKILMNDDKYLVSEPMNALEALEYMNTLLSQLVLNNIRRIIFRKGYNNKNINDFKFCNGEIYCIITNGYNNDTWWECRKDILVQIQGPKINKSTELRNYTYLYTTLNEEVYKEEIM